MDIPQDIANLPFEQALHELEDIVRALEQDERPLEEALALFRRGQALLAHCRRLLEQAELQVQQVLDDDTLAPWSPDEEA